VQTVSDPESRTTTYGYDLAERLTSVLDPMGRATTLGYDAVDELTGVQYSDGTTPNVSYSYTAGGLPSIMQDGTGVTEYTYDPLDRLSDEINGAGSEVQYGYDLAGNLATVGYPDGSLVTRTYTPTNLLQSVTDWSDHTSSFGYDANSNLTNETYPNGVQATLAYDRADALTGIAGSRNGSPFWTFGYARDPLSRAQTATDPVTSASHTYGYDPNGRLTSDATGGGSSPTYGYDAGDNLTSITDAATNPVQTFSPDIAHQLSELTTTVNGSLTSDTPYGYNQDGDRTGASDSVTGDATTYGYNQTDELTSYLLGTTAASYAYNGNGLRTSKTVGGTTIQEAWYTAERLPLLIQDGIIKGTDGRDGTPPAQIAGLLTSTNRQSQSSCSVPVEVDVLESWRAHTRSCDNSSCPDSMRV
jgi:YD repeat-containing protein